MTSLVMFFALLAGALLQSLLPAWYWTGQTPAPLLLGVVVYYALAHDMRRVLQAALAGGLLQDALGMVPWGYSAFAFCVVGWMVHRFRDTVSLPPALSRAMWGALASAAATLLVYLLLRTGDALILPPGRAILKAAGALALGLLVVPMEGAILNALDRQLGNLPTEEAA